MMILTEKNGWIGLKSGKIKRHLYDDYGDVGINA